MCVSDICYDLWAKLKWLKLNFLWMENLKFDIFFELSLSHCVLQGQRSPIMWAELAGVVSLFVSD